MITVEVVAQVFGIAFVAIIMICIGATIVGFVWEASRGPRRHPTSRQNEKLLENMDNYDKAIELHKK